MIDKPFRVHTTKSHHFLSVRCTQHCPRDPIDVAGIKNYLSVRRCLVGRSSWGAERLPLDRLHPRHHLVNEPRTTMIFRCSLLLVHRPSVGVAGACRVDSQRVGRGPGACPASLREAQDGGRSRLAAVLQRLVAQQVAALVKRLAAADKLARIALRVGERRPALGQLRAEREGAAAAAGVEGTADGVDRADVDGARHNVRPRHLRTARQRYAPRRYTARPVTARLHDLRIAASFLLPSYRSVSLECNLAILGPLLKWKLFCGRRRTRLFAHRPDKYKQSKARRIVKS